MNLTSEQVHWIAGVVLIVTAALLLLRSVAVLQGRWLDYVVPAVLVLFAAELALDPLVHGKAMPANYAGEMSQHFIMSAVLAVAAAGELLRVATGQRSFAWRLPMMAALGLAAAIFALHAQHDAPAPMLLLVTQHRMIAATLAAAALAVLLAGRRDAAARDRAAPAFPLLMLVLGLQLLLYTEGSGLSSIGVH